MYNPRLENMFCLRKAQNTTGKDLRKVNVGKRCVNFSKKELTDIIARRIKKPAPREFYQNITRGALEDIARKTNVTVPEDFEGTDDDLRRVIFWGKQLMSKICDNIREWMEEHNLVEEDLNCGQQQKRRERALKS